MGLVVPLLSSLPVSSTAVMTPPTTISVATNTNAPTSRPWFRPELFFAGGAGGGDTCRLRGPLNCVGADAGYGAGVLPIWVNGCCGQLGASGVLPPERAAGIAHALAEADPVTASFAAEAISTVVEYRSAGCFASPVAITWSRAAGIAARSDGLGGGVTMCPTAI